MKFIFLALLVLSLHADKELAYRNLLDDKIKILIPTEFTVLSAELVKLKYPGNNRPKLILSDESGSTNIAFSLLTQPSDSSTIERYKDLLKTIFQKKFPKGIWKGDGVMYVNGKNVAYLKFISQAIDQQIFNYLFLTDVDSQLLVGTFNCTEKTMSEWDPLAEKVVHSLIVN